MASVESPIHVDRCRASSIPIFSKCRRTCKFLHAGIKLARKRRLYLVRSFRHQNGRKGSLGSERPTTGWVDLSVATDAASSGFGVRKIQVGSEGAGQSLGKQLPTHTAKHAHSNTIAQKVHVLTSFAPLCEQLTDYAPPPTGTSIYNNSVDFARFATERSAAFHPIRGLDEFSSSSVTTQVLLAALRPAVYPVSNNLGENGTNREHDEYEILGNGVVVFNNLVPFLKLPVALTGANVPCGVVPAVLRRRFKHSPAILDVLPDDIVDKIVGGLARACVRNAHKSSHKLWLSLRGVSKSFKERADFAACEFVNRTDELYTDLGSAQVNNQNRQGQGQGQGQGQSQSQRLAARKAAETRILRLGLHVQKSRVNLFRMISELEAATAATATTATATTAVATNSAPKQRLLARDCLLIYMRVRGGQGGDPPGRPAQVPSKAKTTWSWTPPRPNPTTKLLHTINLASESRTNH